MQKKTDLCRGHSIQKSLKREFIINTVLVLSLNLAVKVFYIFGIDRQVQNMLGERVYGLYFTLFNLAVLFQIINDFGLRNFNNRHIAHQPHLLQKYLPNLLVFKLVLAVLFLIVYVGASVALGYWALNWMLVLGVGLLHIVVALMQYLRTNISGLGYYRLDSVLSVLDKFLMIVIIGAMIGSPRWRRSFGINHFVWGQVAAVVLASAASLLFVLAKLQFPRLKFDKVLLSDLIKESVPFAILGLLGGIYARVDSVLISKLVSNYEAGVYATAFRLMDAGGMVSLLLTAFLLPMFVGVIKRHESTQEPALFIIKLIWVAGVCLVGPVIVFRLPIMQALYIGGNAYSGNILGLLMFSLLALSWAQITGTLLLAAGEVRRLNKIYLTAVIINVTLNALLIPLYGAIGAAAVSAITQWYVVIDQFRLMNKSELMTLPGTLPVRFAVFFLISLGISWLVFQAHWPLALALVASATGTLLTAWLLALFSPQGLIKVLLNRSD